MKRDVRWAAGLFEGEGCVGYYVDKRRRGEIIMSVASIDHDVIRLFHRAVKVGRCYGPYLYKSAHRHFGTRPLLVWKVSGRKAVALAERMRPWLGRRRRGRIAECVRLWRAYQKELGNGNR